MAPRSRPSRPNVPFRAAAGVFACAALLACHDSPTEPAPAPTPTPTITPIPTPVRPPVAFTATGGGCDPIGGQISPLTADVCGCVTEAMTIRVDELPPQPLACNGTVTISPGSLVTVSTASWSIAGRFGVVDPHCWISVRLVCKP